MSVQKAIPTYRIFVSSTYVDMIPYRAAIQSAINRADCKSVGMEWFGASSTPPLETCKEELKKCQIYVCAIGMRYGSIEKESQKSYTQLEFEYAKHLGMPILAFVVDEMKVKFLASEIDTGKNAVKLISFKNIIKDSPITCDSFSSPSDLELKVFQSIKKEINRQHTNKLASLGQPTSIIEGTKWFSRFVHTPAIYKNREAVLKVRFDGPFGSYMVNDSLLETFGLQPGSVLFLNNLFVLGKEPDVLEKYWSMDCFCEPKAAEWVEDNEITPGTIFTGRFRFIYEQVKEFGKRTEICHAVSTYKTELIMIEGIKINSRKVLISI